MKQASKGPALTSEEIREEIRKRVRPADWSKRPVTYTSIAREARINVRTVTRFVREGRALATVNMDSLVWWLRRHPLDND